MILLRELSALSNLQIRRAVKVILSMLSGAPLSEETSRRAARLALPVTTTAYAVHGARSFFQPGKFRLLAPGFNRFRPERPQWYNNAASRLYGWFLTSLRSLDDLME